MPWSKSAPCNISRNFAPHRTSDTPLEIFSGSCSNSSGSFSGFIQFFSLGFQSHEVCHSRIFAIAKLLKIPHRLNLNTIDVPEIKFTGSQARLEIVPSEGQTIQGSQKLGLSNLKVRREQHPLEVEMQIPQFRSRPHELANGVAPSRLGVFAQAVPRWRDIDPQAPHIEKGLAGDIGVDEPTRRFVPPFVLQDARGKKYRAEQSGLRVLVIGPRDPRHGDVAGCEQRLVDHVEHFLREGAEGAPLGWGLLVAYLEALRGAEGCIRLAWGLRVF